ncbi:MAG: PAS domain S-box protein, partial [Candidatus Eisenbacteria bacterium]
MPARATARRSICASGCWAPSPSTPPSVSRSWDATTATSTPTDAMARSWASRSRRSWGVLWRAGGRERLFDVVYEPERKGGNVESVVVAITDISDRKAVETSLRDQAGLLELAHDAIMLLEMDGTITFWNQGAAETYGFTAEESLGNVAHRLLHTVFPQPLSEIYEAAERQGRWEGELIHSRRDGRRIVVTSRWAVQPAMGDRPARIMEINRDVTERKTAEAALKEKEAELLLVTGASPIILMRCGRDLRYRFVNRAGAELFGLTPQEMIGRPMRVVMGDEAFARVEPFIERVLRGESVEYELEIPYPRAGLRWMRGSFIPDVSESVVVGWFASITDVTERKRVEDKLRDSERTERLLAEIGALAAKGVGRPLDHVVHDICAHVAAEMGVSRCGYGLVDVEEGWATVETEWCGSLPPLRGRYALSNVAPHLVADGLAGRVTVLRDLTVDPRTTNRYDGLYAPVA